MKRLFNVVVLAMIFALIFATVEMPTSTVYAAENTGQSFSPLMTPNTWGALGSGLNGSTYAIAINGTDIYAGGSFTDAGGDVNADRIAKWNGTSWSALGTGLNGQVNTIVVNGSNVYVGGNFTDAGGDPNADYVAQWNGTSWSALGTVLNSTVYVITVSGSNVYVGGNFTDASGDPNADYIAKLDGGTWESLGATPLNATVYTALAIGANLYAGGSFTHAGGDANSDRIAMWDGTAWFALGSGGANSTVKALALSGGDVYVGGDFTAIGGKASARYLGKWDGTSWSALGGGLNSYIRAITVNGTDIYAGGYFTNAGGDANADYIAKWNGTSWFASGNGLDNAVNAIVVNGSDIYASGQFANAGGNANADNIARYEIDASAPTVNSFSAASSSTSLNIPITAFTASDNVAVSKYLITDSSAPPSAGAAGWTASAPTTYTVASDGSYTLYPWAKDTSGNVSAVYGSPASVDVDSAAPTVTSFSVPSSSTSFDIPITEFIASDTIGVTGYLITESSTPPSAGAGDWTASLPTTYTVASDGSYTLYPWAKDAVGHVSAVYASPASINVDASSPTVTSFTAPSSSTSLDIAITAFTASDTVGVVGYLITETDTPPSLDDVGWSASVPTTYTVASSDSYALYPWAKDALGNVSALYGSPASVTVDVVRPTVNSFTVTSPSTSLDVPITAFTASDNIAVSRYLITESSTAPSSGAAGWSVSKPTTFTVASQGSHTLYPWAKDTVGNVSALFGSPRTVSVDTVAPTVTGFSAPASSSSLNIPINTFTASDAVGVTGYLITESSTPPSSGAVGWSASKPTTFTVASQGSHTLYPWAKDAVGHVSSVYGSPASVEVNTTLPDTTPPSVDGFTAVSPSASLDISISAFSASDNMTVTGYLITESSTQPASSDSGWSGSAPTTYTVASDGNYTLYPWAKDAAGNVSSVYGSPASVEVNTALPGDTSAPSVDTFTVASTSNSLDIPITAFTASDDTAVTGYLITESNTQPASNDSGWSVSVPSTFTVASDGSYTLYPWAKDAAGNVSAEFGSPVSVTVDTTAPDVAIDSQPTDLSSSADASFTFSSTDSTAVFECDLDGTGYASCSSPLDYFALSNGSHIFSVRATDTVSNTGAADTYTWTISTYVASERINNGGFNTYPTGKKIPTSWQAVKFSTTDGKNTVKQEGTASVRITGTGASKTLSQTLMLSGSNGDAFTFSFWVKGKSIPTAGICRVQILFYNGTVLNPVKPTINCVKGTYDFNQKTLAFIAPGNYTKIIIRFTYSKASGQVWFDAVSLVQ